MRRINSTIRADFISEQGIDKSGRTYFAYVPLENIVCYAVSESYDSDNDINSAKLAVEAVLTAFERKPSIKSGSIKSYIQYAHDELKKFKTNNLEAAITVVVSDYTRLRYAICGNIKFYLMSDKLFYVKSRTQTKYQQDADEYGLDKVPFSEHKNLLQYLGMKTRPKPYVSKKIELPEESSIFFATHNLWERFDDVEILDAYEGSQEEAGPENFLINMQEQLLLTQFKNPDIRSYTIALIFIEKPYKEDTIKKKKRRRIILTLAIIAIILAIIATIIISIMRASDRRAMTEIERLDSEGIRYSNYGNYLTAYEQYEKASELTVKLKNNGQYTRRKSDLKNIIAERWHLFNSIINGDRYLESGDYNNAYKAYNDAREAYYDVYRAAETHSGLLVSEILTDKIEQIEKYISASDLIKIGDMYELEESYQEALAYFREADEIAKTIGDLTFRREVMTRIFEADRKMNSLVEVNFVRQVRALMENAENNLNFELALQYSEFIIDIYRDLNINDEQSQADKSRIEGKIRMETEVAGHISRARTAEAAGRYDDAVRDYELVLDLFRDIGVGSGHERFREITTAIVNIKNKVESDRLEREVSNYIRNAQMAETALRYDDALIDYSAVLGLFTEMGIDNRNERYRSISDEIVRIEKIIEEIRVRESMEDDNG